MAKDRRLPSPGAPSPAHPVSGAMKSSWFSAPSRGMPSTLVRTETQGIHGAHHIIIIEIAEAIGVKQDQAPLAQEAGFLEVLLELRHGLVGEERVIVGQRGDECRCDAPIVLGSVTGRAGSAVPGKRLVEENVLSLRHEIHLGARRQSRENRVQNNKQDNDYQCWLHVSSPGGSSRSFPAVSRLSITESGIRELKRMRSMIWRLGFPRL